MNTRRAGVDEGEMKPFPELEYVRASYREDNMTERAAPAGVTAISILYVVLGCLVTCALVYWLIPNIWGVGIVILLGAAFVWRLFTSYDVWYTSPEGLQAQGGTRYLSMKWPDVIEARSVGRNHIIKTADATISVPTKTKDIRFLRLEASVFQHLLAVGKSGDIVISREAEGFLSDLPDNIETEVEWRNTDLAWTVYAPALFILVVAASFSAMYFSHIRDFYRLRFFAILILLQFIPEIIRQWLSTAKSVTFKDGVLSAKTLFGRCEWSIYNIRKVRWILLDRLELRVNKQRIVIPISKEDPNARKLILALIKLLRENHGRDVMPIPAFLQEGMDG